MINEIKAINLYLDKQVILLSTKIENIYASLNELKRTSNLLLKLTQNDKEAISNWLKQKEFKIQNDGFYVSKKDIEGFEKNNLEKDSIGYHWDAKNKNHKIICFELYALREIGKLISIIKEKLGDVSFVYYQDIINNTTLFYPYMKIEDIVPVEFVWSDYFAAKSVNPENNPSKEIKWSVPNIDYGGKGLISIASIPIYKNEVFSGVWSIDVPHRILYESIVVDTYLINQKNFITDYNGNLIYHPDLEVTINKDKGSFIQINIFELVQNYKKLNIANLIKEKKGEFEIVNDENETEFFVYQIIPNLEWILFVSFPKDEIKKELEKQNIELKLKIKEQVESIREKDLQLFEQSKLASMGEMIGNIAHQWRQPLSVITMNSSGMKIEKELGTLDDESFNKSCDAINNNAQYLSQTIDDFKNFIKGDRTRNIFSLTKDINSFLYLMESTIKNNNINVVLDLDDSIKINGYENELTQCFINIFNNAKDVLIDKNIENKFIFISTKIKENNAVIKITDNGNGIPENIINKIFEPYFTTKHQSQGTGLGLHMTYNLIVEGMSGTIEVHNVNYEYNEKKYDGVELIITLPLD